MESYIFALSIDYVMFFTFNIIFSSIIIMLERKSPTTALAWLFFMVLFPGIGFFFYLMLSQNISKRKIFNYTIAESEIFKSLLEKQRKEFESHTYEFNDPTMQKYTHMIIFQNKLSEAFYSQNNELSIYTDGKKKFAELFNEIIKANHHIHLVYYIVKNDHTSTELFNLLIQKAKEGVEVRLLVDYVGGRKIRHSTLKILRAHGCKVEFFFPSKIKYFNSKANYRNHRKMVIIDGVVGFLGGFNIGDEYLGLNKRFGYWRDTHLKIQGDAVLALQLRFLLDWRAATNELIEFTRDYIKETPSHGKSGVQIVSCGPDSINEQIKQGYIKLIASANKNIYIQTPYFIPDDSIMEALKIASVSGIDVKIMIPNKPDHMFVYWATYSYVGELLKYGARIYIYEKGFLHAKTITIDDEISSVGTCNFDIRSFKLNFEVNAFIYDKKTSKNLSKIFKQDLKNCSELTREHYAERPFIIKVKEAISRLFSPIL